MIKQFQALTGPGGALEVLVLDEHGHLHCGTLSPRRGGGKHVQTWYRVEGPGERTHAPAAPPLKAGVWVGRGRQQVPPELTVGGLNADKVPAPGPADLTQNFGEWAGGQGTGGVDED